MFCQECGQKLADGTKFCPYCGAKIQAAPPLVEETTEQEETVEVRPEPEEEAPPPKNPAPKPRPKTAPTPEAPRPAPEPAPKPAGKGGKTGLYAIVGLVAVIVLAVVLIKGVFGGGTTVSVMDCVNVTISGVDGNGRAYFDFDIQPIFDAVSQKMTLTERMREEIQDLTDDIYKDIVLSDDSNLSNGDKIKVSSSVDKDLLKAYKVKLKNGDKTIKVEDLVKVQEVNVKDYVQVEFSGFDGFGAVYLNQDYDGLISATAELIRKADNSEEAEEYISDSLPSVIYNMSWIYEGEDYQKNGNEVTYHCSGPDYIEKYGIHFIYEDVTATVDGLIPVETLSLADYMKLSCEGINGSAYARAELDEEKLLDYLTELFEKEQRGAYGAAGENFDAATEAESAVNSIKNTWREQFVTMADPSENLSNGDEVTVTLTPSYTDNNEVNMVGAGFTLIGGSGTFTVDSLGDYHLGITSTEDEELKAFLAPYETSIEAAFDEKKDWINQDASQYGWVAWDQVPDGKVTPVLEKVDTVTWDEGDYYDAGNMMLAVYHMSLPVRQFDRSMTTLDIYYGMKFNNVVKTDDGKLNYDYDPDTSFLVGDEKLNSWLSDHKNNVMENGTNVQEEEAVSDLTSVQETEGETEENTTEAAVEAISVETPQAGTIAEGAANQAAATVVYEGHTYARFDIALNYSQAEKFCEQAGGHLATLTSWRENLAVQSILDDASYDEYWLGASDEEWEGSWKWTTGEAFDWTNWDDSQPDNYNGDEDFLTIYSYYGSWNDRSTDEEDIGFVLEIDPVSEGSPSGEYDLLSDLVASGSHNCDIWKQLEDPYGNKHFASVVLDASENGWVKYELDGNYNLFTATLSTCTDAESDASFEIAIWGDGKLLYSRYNYQKTDAPETIALNTTGISKLSIKMANRGGYNNGFLGLNEAKLWKNGTAETLPVLVDELGDLTLIDSEEYGDYSEGEMYTDVYGNVHENWYDFEEEDLGARAVYWLGGKYTTFEGTVLTGTGSYDTGTLKIFADGTEVYSISELDVYQGGQNFSLDVTGKETLEIDGYGVVYVADTRLVRAESETLAPVTDRYTFPELPEAVEERAIDYRIYKNKKYYRFDQGLTWSQADAFCKAAGGTLAMPKNAAENSAIFDLIDDGNYEYYWLGGYKAGTIWKWNDGETINADGFWGSSQPDNYEENENYLCMYSYDDSWNDLSDQNEGFVLELTAAEPVDDTAVMLTSLEWQENYSSEIVNGYDGANLYPNSVKLRASENAYFRVALNGAYQTLSGILDPDGGSSVNADFSLAIFGDGKLLYKKEHFTRKDPREVFSVDVSGVKTLTVETDNPGSYDGGYVYLMDPELTRAEASASSGIAKLSEQVLVDGIGETYIAGLFRDSYGELHDGCLKLAAGDGAKVTYNVGGAYTTLSGSIAAGDKTSYEGGISVKIYGDGNQLYEISDFGKMTGTQSFEVDITGCQVVAIEASGDYDSCVYVTDDQLK